MQKIQEKRSSIANQNIQLVTTKTRDEALELNISTRGGLNTKGIPEEQRHHPKVEWVQPVVTKDYVWDLQKQKETFLQAKQEFYEKGASSSKTKDIRREPVTIPLQINPCE